MTVGDQTPTPGESLGNLAQLVTEAVSFSHRASYLGLRVNVHTDVAKMSRSG